MTDTVVDSYSSINKHWAFIAVVKNLSALTDVERERILLAAAVFYGIIKPIPPRKKKPKAGLPNGKAASDE